MIDLNKELLKLRKYTSYCSHHEHKEHYTLLRFFSSLALLYFQMKSTITKTSCYDDTVDVQSQHTMKHFFITMMEWMRFMRVE